MRNVHQYHTKKNSNLYYFNNLFWEIINSHDIILIEIIIRLYKYYFLTRTVYFYRIDHSSYANAKEHEHTLSGIKSLLILYLSG